MDGESGDEVDDELMRDEMRMVELMIQQVGKVFLETR